MDELQRETFERLLPLVGRTVRVGGAPGSRTEKITDVDMTAGTVTRLVEGDAEPRVSDADTGGVGVRRVRRHRGS